MSLLSLTYMLPKNSSLELPAFVNHEAQSTAFLQSLDTNTNLMGPKPTRTTEPALTTPNGGAFMMQGNTILVYKKTDTSDLQYAPAAFQLNYAPQDLQGYTLYFSPSLWADVTMATGSDGETIPLEILERRLGREALENASRAKRNQLKLHIEHVIKTMTLFPIARTCPNLITADYANTVIPFWLPLKRSESQTYLINKSRKDSTNTSPKGQDNYPPYLDEITEDLNKITQILVFELETSKTPISADLGAAIMLHGGEVGQRGYLSPLHLVAQNFNIDITKNPLFSEMGLLLHRKYQKALSAMPWIGGRGATTLYKSEKVYPGTSGHQYMANKAWYNTLKETFG